MTRRTPANIKVETFDTHFVITPPNELRHVLRPLAAGQVDDPVVRAEKALAGLASEFRGWMKKESARLTSALAAIDQHGLDKKRREELFLAAHDIKGDAATFGYPKAAEVADSLCRLIEHSPDLAAVPSDMIAHHVNTIAAIIRERPNARKRQTAEALSRELRGLADEFLTTANKDRPEHLEAVLAPSIVPHD